MKIILADDHPLFRDGLRSMLGSEANCHEASNLNEILIHLELHSDTKLILMALNMPGMDGFDGLKKVRRLYPEIPLIVVSMHCDPAIIRTAFSHGASGYIPKTHSFECMQKAIDLVLSGSPYIPQEALANGNSGDSPAIHLTRRQKDIYALLMQGKSNQEIADSLCISLSTVKMHVGSVLEKAGVKNRSQLLALGRNSQKPFTAEFAELHRV
jgi:DNA-binding NarL/FixJ family response regulator